MFNIKGNLKGFHSEHFCNGVLYMSVLIILSPYYTFPKLAIKNVIEFFLLTLIILVWYLISEI